MTKADNFGWTQEQDERLRQLVSRGQLFNTAIALEIGKRPASIGWRIKKLGLKPTRERIDQSRMGKWNTKHKHLREDVMKFFLTHTAEETQKRFELTKSEFKSLMTVCYRIPQFKHLRKETRTHEAWSVEQLVFLLQHAGLRPRKWIVKQLGRGASVHVVKDRLSTLGIGSRNLQGITLSQFQKWFGVRPDYFLQTRCGPDRGTGSHGKAATHWKIVPWVVLDMEVRARRLKVTPEMKAMIDIRAMFQRWIFGNDDVLFKMSKICRDSRREARA